LYTYVQFLFGLSKTRCNKLERGEGQIQFNAFFKPLKTSVTTVLS